MTGVFDWRVFLAAAGLALVIEGLPYFLSPDGVKRAASFLPRIPNPVLRLLGLAGMAAGLAVVGLSRLFG